MSVLRNNLYIIILITLLAAGMSACQNSKSEDASKTGSAEKRVDQSSNKAVAELLAQLNMHYFDKPIEAPLFELDSVKGGKVSLSQYRGNVVLLSFWATW